jgi:hypothetical protein
MLLRQVDEQVKSVRMEAEAGLTSASKQCVAAGQALHKTVNLRLLSTNTK